MRFIVPVLVMAAAPLLAGPTQAQAPEKKPPIAAIAPFLTQDVDANGDTLLIRTCRAVLAMPAQHRKTMLPILRLMLENGASSLQENYVGCSALLYINGMPEIKEELYKSRCLPKELTLRIPYDERALLRYMRFRTDQAQYVHAPGSHDYMVRRYAAPAYDRAQTLFQTYFKSDTAATIPDGAMGDCLALMRLAKPQETADFINSLGYWEHGEHFLEEIPRALLADLNEKHWKVPADKLRSALEKLATLLPASSDDMIDCDAATPMSKLLEMLTRNEGMNALPDLQRFSQAHDPNLSKAALRMQLKLLGIPAPDEGTPAAGQEKLHDALKVDAALSSGTLKGIHAETIASAAACYRELELPLRAEFIEGLLENGAIIATKAAMPDISGQYDSIREESPSVRILRSLLPQTKEDGV